MTQKGISILSLYWYTQREGFENQIHLTFLIDDYYLQLENEVNSISLAANIQLKYLLESKIKLISKDFRAKSEFLDTTVIECEKLIRNRVENIMSLDIALLKFIASVPDLIKSNSFNLPQDADETYLMREYMTIKERQIITKISNAYELSQMTNLNDLLKPIIKLESVVFDNQRYLTRVSNSKLREISAEDEMLKKDYISLIDFASRFFENSKNRTISDTANLPEHLTRYGLDIRQTMYAMSSSFALTSDTHRNISNFFTGQIKNDHAQTKRKKTSHMSLRECSLYTNNFMVLVVYLIMLEEYQKLDDGIGTQIEQYHRQIILILNSMIEQLLEYIQYNSVMKKKVIQYSQLPLLNIDNLATHENSVLKLIYILQYILNFAPFLFYTI